MRYLADVGGLKLEQIDSAGLEFVLAVLGTHEFERSGVTLAAVELDEDVSVGARSALLACLHRHVVRRRCISTTRPLTAVRKVKKVKKVKLNYIIVR